MKYMLDTNICIYAIKKDPSKVIANLNKHNPEDICISSITYAELMHGVEKSKANVRNLLALTTFLTNIEILDFNADASQCYGEFRSQLESEGTPIGPLDTLIAGHAKSLGYTLVTNNLKEFNRIKDLKTVNWI